MVETMESATGEDEFRAGRFPEAKAGYLRAVRDGRGDARTLERLGLISLYENRAEEAVRYLEEATALRSRLRRAWPFDAGVKARIALAHYRMDRFARAANLFAEAAGPIPAGPFGEPAAFARQLGLFGDDPPYRIEGPGATRLELIATDPLPVVELSVNGRPSALFLIDTGGAEIVLDRAYAADVGAEMAGSITGEYAGGKRAKTGLGRVATVRAGEMRVAAVPIHTLDLKALPAYFGIDVKGVLGTRFLMHFLPTIDYRGGALVLRRDRSERRPETGGDLALGGATAIPFWLVDIHLILARGTLNGLPPTLFLVDTGLAGKGFLASEPTLRRAGVEIDWSLAYEGPGGGGPVRVTDVEIDTLTLGEGDRAITHRDVPPIVQEKAPSSLGIRYGFEIGGLISHAFFREHVLTFDFANMRLIVG